MNTKNLLLLAALCVACTGFATAQSIVLETTTPFEQVDIGKILTKSIDPKTWVVAVGISQYQAMQALPYSATDAQEFSKYWTSIDGGAISDEQVVTILSSKATKQNILNALEEVFSKAKENDIVVFYFSGHGEPGFLIPSDYDGSNESKKLPFEDINKQFGDCKAKYKLFFVDACYSGSYYMSIDKAIIEMRTKMRGGFASLFSSSAKQVSRQIDSLEGGVFSVHLIKGLRGSADGSIDKSKDGIVTLEELARYVTYETSTYTQKQQTPAFELDNDNKHLKQLPISKSK